MAITLEKYPSAAAGDLVFIRNDIKKLPVETYQFFRRLPHPDMTHVALVVSPIDIVEAMKGKVTHSMTFPEWRKTRRKTDDFVILRAPDADISNSDAIVTAAHYYLNEEYALLDALWDRPGVLGRSICSGFAANILRRAGVLSIKDADTPKGQLYPGQLYKIAAEAGWYEVLYSEDYFGGGLVTPEQSPMRSRMMVHQINDRMNKTMDTADEIVAGLQSFLTVLPTNSLLQGLNLSKDNSIFQYLRDRINIYLDGQERAMVDRVSGAMNWKDEPLHSQRIARISDETQVDQQQIMGLLDEVFETVIGTMDLDEFKALMYRASAEAKLEKDIAVPTKQEIARRYIDAEIAFRKATGFATLGMAEFNFEFDEKAWDTGDDYLDELLDRMFVEVAKYFESIVNVARGRADGVQRLRNLFEVCVGAEIAAEIDQNIEKTFAKISKEFS